MSTKVVDFITRMWQKVSILSKKIPVVYYVIVFFVLVIFVTNELYLWHKDSNNAENSSQQKTASKANDPFVIISAQRDNMDEFNKEVQGTTDSTFELATYGSPKNIAVKNAVVKLSKDRSHSGKNSLYIKRDGKQASSVRLKSYVVTQKDQYYKLGLWISSTQGGNFDILLSNDDQSLPVATVGIVANQKNEFSYYEYNFRSPVDATHVDLSIAGDALKDVFIDDIKVIPLNIDKQEDLASIKVTAIGDGRQKNIGAKQTVHSATADALAVKGTLVGQSFIAKADTVTGVSFALVKKGDGGIGEYTVELREFDETTKTISDKKIAVKTFNSGEVTSATTFIPLFAQLEKGKKYWIGINNAGVKLNKDHNLVVGQAGDDRAYPDGDGWMQRGADKTFVKTNDLYFIVYTAGVIKVDNVALSFGETLYDLGKGKKRAEYQWDTTNGNKILDIDAQNNISVDKWKNISFVDDDAYVVYKVGMNGKNIDRLTLANISFHKNISIALSTDGKKWMEVFADDSGKPRQNSGKIEVRPVTSAKNVFIKVKKNGKDSSTFMGGHVILDLVDQNYGK
ncbi:MAG: hypothetical protein WC819_00985 [Parcubacteria group bacterium]|jgi:hypothetical protein